MQMKIEKATRVFGHSIDEFRRWIAVRIFQRRIQHDLISFLRQVFRDNTPHGGMTKTLAKMRVKTLAKYRIIFAPGITACHGKRPPCGLQSPLCAAQKAARRVGFVKLERMNMLTPQAVSAA